MYSLPLITEIKPKKILTKKSLYERFEFKKEEKKIFDSFVERVSITHHICNSTVPSISEGNIVKNLYVVDIILKEDNFNLKIVSILSKYIKQHMIFVFIFNEKCMLSIYRKYTISSELQDRDNVLIPLIGDNLDIVYENIIYFISNLKPKENLSLDEQLEIKNKILFLDEKISSLINKKNKTKQSKDKLKLFDEIKEYEKERAFFASQIGY